MKPQQQQTQRETGNLWFALLKIETVHKYNEIQQNRSVVHIVHECSAFVETVTESS